MNLALTSHIALQSACVWFPVLIDFVCLCVCSDRPRQQTPRHRLDHSQAGRQSAARQSNWQKRGKRVSEWISSKWVEELCRAEHQSERERAGERGGVFVYVIVCVCVAVLAVCASVLPSPASWVGLCWAVLIRAGLCLNWLPSLCIVCLLPEESGARWRAVATAVERKKRRRREHWLHWAYKSCSPLSLPLFLTEG